jgi:hypothetical protein
MRTIKDMVKDQQQVTFLYYKDGELWYKTECEFEFPVPISDVGTATMLATDKAMLFMRYIRKHMALLAEARLAV